MITFKQSGIINAKIDKVFTLVAAPDKIPE